MEVSTRISTVSFFIIAAYIVIFGFLWRSLSAYLAQKDNPLGKAMAYIY